MVISTLAVFFFLEVSHGILFIFHSGHWMIIASSGVPQIGVGPAFTAFPPEIPTLFQCDPKTCISLHKKGKKEEWNFFYVKTMFLMILLFLIMSIQNYVTVVPMLDLVLGSVFMFLGSFYLGDGTDGSPENFVTKVVIGLSWAYSLFSKLMIHSQHRFEAPYFKEHKKDD